MSEWRKHTGTEMPVELAAAQIVEIGHLYATGKIFDGSSGVFDRADSAPWSMAMEYRPALDPDGLPYVSTEGLEDWARYVMKDENGYALQTNETPNGDRLMYVNLPSGREEWEHFALATIYIEHAPQTHAKPGPVSESVMRVW